MQVDYDDQGSTDEMNEERCEAGGEIGSIVVARIRMTTVERGTESACGR